VAAGQAITDAALKNGGFIIKTKKSIKIAPFLVKNRVFRGL
jgi:hypothetical protein